MRGRSRKRCFVNFCSLVVLQSSVDEGWWGGAKSLIQGQLKLHLFPAGISAEAIGFHSSTVTFTVNSHTDNHFCKYIPFKYYTVFSFSFFIKIHIKVLTKVFYIQLCFECETPLFFLLTIFHYILFTHGVTCNLSR